MRLTRGAQDVLDAGRRARAELEVELIAKVGRADAGSARRVLASLLEVVGLGDDARRRSVPAPRDYR